LDVDFFYVAFLVISYHLDLCIVIVVVVVVAFNSISIAIVILAFTEFNFLNHSICNL